LTYLRLVPRRGGVVVMVLRDRVERRLSSNRNQVNRVKPCIPPAGGLVDEEDVAYMTMNARMLVNGAIQRMNSHSRPLPLASAL
jgi:hypothetical protein